MNLTFLPHSAPSPAGEAASWMVFQLFPPRLLPSPADPSQGRDLLWEAAQLALENRCLVFKCFSLQGDKGKGRG